MAVIPVRITRSGNELRVVSPFNTRFPAKARALAGRWQGGAWLFDARDEQRVRDLCRAIYGSDGEVCDWVTLRIEWLSDDSRWQGPIAVHGRVIAGAKGRDTGAKLGADVVLWRGKASPRAGHSRTGAPG